MCLYIDQDKKVQIAEKEITCFKIIIPNTENKWQAIFKKTEHEFNKELVALDILVVVDCSEIPLVQNGVIRSTRKIESGFHAYRDIDEAKKTLTRLGISEAKIVKAVIPKGSEYCFGVFGDIVSNKIIVTEDEAL